MHTLVDCQGLAGAWTLGAVRAGFQLVHRASLGAYGDEVINANRHLVGDDWTQDDGNGPHEWTPARCGFLCGTPPCSGFSLLNKSKKANARGVDSAVNNCMRELVAYAGGCTGEDERRGPEIVSLESVQGAYTLGRPLMQHLRAELERLTSQPYSLSHVLMSGSAVGAAQMRHRYFAVWHRVPFGVDPPERRRVVTYRDAIGDLSAIPPGDWSEQHLITYAPDRAWWLDEQSITNRRPGSHLYTVRDHVEPSNGRIERILEHLLSYWPSGRSMEDALREMKEDLGALPEPFDRWWNHDEDEMRGYTHETRIRADRPGYVLTGGGVFGYVHWERPRFLTVRECARLMGYPDAWTWGAAKNVSQASNWIGKCCPVQSGEWIAGWFKRALDGTPGAPLEEIGDREYLHNSTLLYKPWLKKQGGDKPLSIPRRVSQAKIQRQRFDSSVSNKRYDFAKSEHRRLRIKPGDVVLDLGAYVGAYVSVALDAGASHVVAVEANPDAFKIFEEGIGANENVTAVWAAVSEQPGDEVLLYVPRKSGTTMASITRHVGDPVRVPRVSLAELIERYEPDVVKIDIEGAEWELLDAGLKLPGVRALCLEFHRAGAGDDFVGRIRDAFTDMRGRGWTALNNVPKPVPTSKWPTYGFWEAT